MVQEIRKESETEGGRGGSHVGSGFMERQRVMVVFCGLLLPLLFSECRSQTSCFASVTEDFTQFLELDQLSTF